ncbi:hypothetical protein KIL84_010865 [Mauremys mutica]|uniref:Uncharacterized protein n=1 Tax=Mauremys mutica TaxID=74926 RepID=A0A9D4B0G1_9SAUR|nr:hypothetical protein KIL84_010865 [Mauremys mutica]
MPMHPISLPSDIEQRWPYICNMVFLFTAFVRKDALPSVTFSKYTWHITNILQVKQIFDTPEMPLEITRSFIQNRDGTYELFKCPKVEVESIAETYECLDKQPILWPLELKTFLKVAMGPEETNTPLWQTVFEPGHGSGEMGIANNACTRRNNAVEKHEARPLGHDLFETPAPGQENPNESKVCVETRHSS